MVFHDGMKLLQFWSAMYNITDPPCITLGSFRFSSVTHSILIILISRKAIQMQKCFLYQIHALFWLKSNNILESFAKSENSIFKGFSVKLKNNTNLCSSGLNFYLFGPIFWQEDVLIKPNWISATKTDNNLGVSIRKTNAKEATNLVHVFRRKADLVTFII